MIDIQDVIPHRPPMRLIDRLHSQAAMQVTTTAQVNPQSGFYDVAAGGVPGWVGLEYMAQTAAVWIGLRDHQAGRTPEPAFLVSARQYQAYEPVFPAGSHFFIDVSVKLMDANIVSFVGKIYDDSGKVWADALFTAFRPDDVQAYLQGES